MKARFVRFGVVELDGERYERDVVVDRGAVSRRNKAASKPLRERYGHTPLTLAEGIPWDCRQLIVGTGADGALPILDEVREEARRRGVELVALPTREACREPCEGSGGNPPRDLLSSESPGSPEDEAVTLGCPMAWSGADVGCMTMASASLGAP